MDIKLKLNIPFLNILVLTLSSFLTFFSFSHFFFMLFMFTFFITRFTWLTGFIWIYSTSCAIWGCELNVTQWNIRQTQRLVFRSAPFLQFNGKRFHWTNLHLWARQSLHFNKELTDNFQSACLTCLHEMMMSWWTYAAWCDSKLLHEDKLSLLSVMWYCDNYLDYSWLLGILAV